MTHQYVVQQFERHRFNFASKLVHTDWYGLTEHSSKSAATCWPAADASGTTRWNSNLAMLQSVLSNADQLKKFADEFADKTLQRSLLDVNIELLK